MDKPRGQMIDLANDLDDDTYSLQNIMKTTTIIACCSHQQEQPAAREKRDEVHVLWFTSSIHEVIVKVKDC